MCSERSQQKPDRDEANEEDLWEEKELTFSPASTTATTNSNVRETTLVPAADKDGCEKEDGDAKDSEDSDEDLDSPWEVHQVPEASSTPRAENVVEDMEVTTDDWAKFDEIPMEVAPVVAPSPWSSSGKEAESTTTGGDGGWAKFETGGTAEVRNNESDGGWANFSPMNWTEQEDANTASPAVSQATDVRTAAYVVTRDEAVGSTAAVVTDAGKHPTGNNADVATATSSSTGSSGSSQGPCLSSAIENGPA